MKLSDIRSPENLLAASQSLQVTVAPRYKKDARGTWCNIYLADVLNILIKELDGGKIPHNFDLDGAGPKPKQELRANMIVDALSKGIFPGWKLVTSALDAANRAKIGLPTIAVWANPNPAHSGHVALVVPAPDVAPPGAVYVTCAGSVCVERVPLSHSFGTVKPILFWGHD